MAISNLEFMRDALNRISQTGLVVSKTTFGVDISGLCPDMIHTALCKTPTSFIEEEVNSLIFELTEEASWYVDDLVVGEVSIVPAGNAFLIIILLFNFADIQDSNETSK